LRLPTPTLRFLLFGFFFLKEGNKKDEASRQKEATAKHRPKTPDTRDTKSYCRNSKKNPSEKINCLIFHLSHSKRYFAPPLWGRYIRRYAAN
jgi:hypothetical protein